jgi:hypothetical protein
MPKKECNIIAKHIPTKREVKESTDEMLKAIAFSEKEPIKTAASAANNHKNTEVLTSVFDTNKAAVKCPAGKSVVFEDLSSFTSISQDSNSV